MRSSWFKHSCKDLTRLFYFYICALLQCKLYEFWLKIGVLLLYSIIILLLQVTCVICLGGMEVGKGKAIFTGECSHSFHFNCIGENVKHGNLICPICRSKWKEIPSQFGADVTIVRRIRVLHRVNHSRPLPTVSPPLPQHVQFFRWGIKHYTYHGL